MHPLTDPEPDVRVDASASLLQRMFDSLSELHAFVVPVTVGDTITDFEFVFANLATCAALRVPREELIGSRLVERFTTAVPTGAVAACVDVVTNGTTSNWEEVPIGIEHKGIPVHYDVRILPLDNGAHVIWRNVSQRVAERRRLEESEARYRLLAANVDATVALCTTDGTVLEMSDSVTQLLGWDSNALRQRSCAELVVDEDLPALMRAKQAATQSPTQAYIRMLTVDDEQRWIRCTINPIAGTAGEPDAAFAIVLKDARDEVRSRAALASADERLRLTMAASDSAIALLDNTGHLRQVNAALCDLLRGDEDHLCTLHWTDFTIADDKAQDSIDIVEIRKGNLQRNRTRRTIVRCDGTLLPVDVSISTAHDADGAVRHYVITIVPAPLDAALDGHHELMLANVLDAVLSLGEDGTVRTASERWSVFSDLDPGQWPNRRLTEVGLAPALCATLEAAADAAQRNGYPVTFETMVHERSTQQVVACRATPVEPPEAPERLVIITVRDVTEERSARAELEQRSNRDRVTDLPNSVALEEELGRSLAFVGRVGGRVTVLLFDLNAFRRVGETHGPAVGDAVLNEFASRLRRAARPSDLVARLERDRFVAVLRGTHTADDAQAIALRMHSTTETPITVRGIRLDVSCAIGIAQSLPESSPATLIGAASAACGRAKRLRALVGFAPGSEPVAADADPRAGVSAPSDELDLWFQPVVDLANLLPVGYEALLRRRRADGSIPDSADFLAEAVADGRIHDLGAWALREVAGHQAAHRDDALSHKYLSVNVSGAELAQPGYPMFLRAVIDRAGANAAQLRVEIDEATLLSTSAIVRRNLTEVKAMGVELIVDHFGADTGAVASLRHVAVRAIKLDRAITVALLDPNGGEYERPMIDLARSIGVDVVATGVTTLADANALLQAGCTHAQGAAFGRPRPMAQLWNDVDPVQ